VSDTVYVSNAPDAAVAIHPVAYPTVVFPWSTPVSLETGDVVIVDLEARLVQDDYIWSWKTSVLDRGRSDADKARFAQSTFFGVPLSRAALRKRAPNYSPCLTEEGRITRLVLGAMGDAASLDDIARLVSTEFAARFPRPEDALSYVADLSQRYG
jgi:hypothetical protein